MPGVKIKIECEDPLLAAAVASSISKGLELDDFTNVMVKTTMVYSEAYARGDPSPRDTFDASNGILSMMNPKGYSAIAQKVRPRMTETILLPPEPALGHPICNDRLRETAPEKLGAPIVIDMDSHLGEYAKIERAFLNAENLEA